MKKKILFPILATIGATSIISSAVVLTSCSNVLDSDLKESFRYWYDHVSTAPWNIKDGEIKLLL